MLPWDAFSSIEQRYPLEMYHMRTQYIEMFSILGIHVYY